MKGRDDTIGAANRGTAGPCARRVAVEAALTPAEREVLRLVALGLDNPAIAQQLQKSEKTVRNQVSSIFDKLGVRTRAEAIVHVRNREPGS